MLGGLEVLNKNGIYIPAKPMHGSFVVNVGDFLGRISNDILFQRFIACGILVGSNAILSPFSSASIWMSRSRYISIPFYLRTNCANVSKVLPSCVSEETPAKYGPRNFNKVGHSLSDCSSWLIALCIVYSRAPKEPEKKA
jgi:hypothetical protein